MKNPKWQLEQQVTEDQLLESGQEDNDLEAEVGKVPVPAGVVLDDLDVLLVGKLDAEQLGAGLGEIAKADGRKCDHRPCLEGEFQVFHASA